MQESSYKARKSNRTTQRKKVARAVAKKSNEVRAYNCTVCGNPVVKRKPCGVRSEAERAESAAGLGKFKCRCGNKAVKVVISQRGVPSAEKVAA